MGVIGNLFVGICVYVLYVDIMCVNIVTDGRLLYTCVTHIKVEPEFLLYAQHIQICRTSVGVSVLSNYQRLSNNCHLRHVSMTRAIHQGSKRKDVF